MTTSRESSRDEGSRAAKRARYDFLPFRSWRSFTIASLQEVESFASFFMMHELSAPPPLGTLAQYVFTSEAQTSASAPFAGVAVFARDGPAASANATARQESAVFIGSGPRCDRSTMGRGGAEGNRAARSPRQAPALQRVADLVEHARVVDGGGHRPRLAVGDLLHRPAQDLARAGLGQPPDRDGDAERRHGPDLLPHEADELRLDVVRRGLDPGLQDHEPARHLALELVLHADHGAFGDGRVRGEHLLHAAGREPVP